MERSLGGSREVLERFGSSWVVSGRCCGDLGAPRVRYDDHKAHHRKSNIGHLFSMVFVGSRSDLGTVFGRYWGGLKGSCGDLASILGDLGRFWGALRSVLGDLGAILALLNALLHGLQRLEVVLERLGGALQGS